MKRNIIPKFRNPKITIMLARDSDEEIKRVSSSFLWLITGGVFLGIICFGLTFFIVKTLQINKTLKEKTELCANTRANIDAILDEVANFQQISNRFQASLSKVVEISERNPNISKLSIEHNLESFIFGEFFEDLGNNSLELNNLRKLKDTLKESSGPIEALSETIIRQGDILDDIPTLWPVENGDGRITQLFGICEHPFTKDCYLHKGLDIGYGRGKPIVAAGNGVVIKKWYHRTYGLNLIIKHDLSHRTRYAHFDKIYVDEGDRVLQGQVIGTMGNTGLSTGPHLHFEVQVGTQVVDPLEFVSNKPR